MLCNKPLYRKETFQTHLRTVHGLNDKTPEEKAKVSDLASRFYYGGTNNPKNYWCGFCIDPETGRRGTKIMESWAKRSDHIARHFSNNLSIAEWTHEDDDLYSDIASNPGNDEDFDDEQCKSAIDVLASAAISSTMQTATVVPEDQAPEQLTLQQPKLQQSNQRRPSQPEGFTRDMVWYCVCLPRLSWGCVTDVRVRSVVRRATVTTEAHTISVCTPVA